jgi:hypothetical protein
LKSASVTAFIELLPAGRIAAERPAGSNSKARNGAGEVSRRMARAETARRKNFRCMIIQYDCTTLVDKSQVGLRDPPDISLLPNYYYNYLKFPFGITLILVIISLSRVAG